MLASITNHNHAIADLRAQSRSGWEQSTGQNGSKQRQRGQAKQFPHENPHSTKRLHATVSIPFVQHACSRSLGGRSKTCAQDRRLRHGAAKQCATWSGAGAHAPQAKQRQPKLGGKHGGDHQAVKLVNAHRRHAGRTDLNRQLRRGRETISPGTPSAGTQHHQRPAAASNNSSKSRLTKTRAARAILSVTTRRARQTTQRWQGYPNPGPKCFGVFIFLSASHKSTKFQHFVSFPTQGARMS